MNRAMIKGIAKDIRDNTRFSDFKFWYDTGRKSIRGQGCIEKEFYGEIYSFKKDDNGFTWIAYLE